MSHFLIYLKLNTIAVAFMLLLLRARVFASIYA